MNKYSKIFLLLSLLFKLTFLLSVKSSLAQPYYSCSDFKKENEDLVSGHGGLIFNFASSAGTSSLMRYFVNNLFILDQQSTYAAIYAPGRDFFGNTVNSIVETFREKNFYYLNSIKNVLKASGINFEYKQSLTDLEFRNLIAAKIKEYIAKGKYEFVVLGKNTCDEYIKPAAGMVNGLFLCSGPYTSTDNSPWVIKVPSADRSKPPLIDLVSFRPDPLEGIEYYMQSRSECMSFIKNNTHRNFYCNSKTNDKDKSTKSWISRRYDISLSNSFDLPTKSFESLKDCMKYLKNLKF